MGFFQFTGGTLKSFLHNPLNPKEAVAGVHALFAANYKSGCTTPSMLMTAHNRGAGAALRYKHNPEALPGDSHGNPSGTGFYRGVKKQNVEDITNYFST